MPRNSLYKAAFGALLASAMLLDGGPYASYRPHAAPKSRTEIPYTQPMPQQKEPNKRSEPAKKASGMPGNEWIEIKAKLTAYCPCKKCCGPNARGKTSLGDDAHVADGVAVDPRAIPYRSIIEIPGIGTREADDTGGAMRQAWGNGKYHIDVRFPTHDEAKRFGVRHETVRILRNQNGKKKQKVTAKLDFTIP